MSPYKFQKAEIGVMAEVLLPKRIRYQGSLFKSFEYALEKFTFADYFGRASNIARVESLLEHYDSLKKLADIDLPQMDKDFPDFFQGYSMYEVDGVYRFKKEQINFAEERTQVIRLFFLPPYSTLLTRFETKLTDLQLRNFSDIYFASSKITSTGNHNADKRFARYAEFINRHPDKTLLPDDVTITNALLDYFDLWVDAVALFVFGYIINQITLNLEELGLHDPDAHEEEIWVTTQWGALINRTVHIR